MVSKVTLNLRIKRTATPKPVSTARQTMKEYGDIENDGISICISIYLRQPLHSSNTEPHESNTMTVNIARIIVPMTSPMYANIMIFDIRFLDLTLAMIRRTHEAIYGNRNPENSIYLTSSTNSNDKQKKNREKSAINIKTIEMMQRVRPSFLFFCFCGSSG